MKKKIVAFILVFALALALGIGGTLAWLTDKTGEIENTFTVGDITLELNEYIDDPNVEGVPSDEEGWTEAETEKQKSFKIVPGGSDYKKPVLTVTSGSEKCYVYAYVENAVALNDGTEVATPEIGSDWVKIGETGVETVYRYVNVVDASSAAVKLTVFEVVNYSDDITKDNRDEVIDDTITIQGFAYQAENRTQGDADAAALEQFKVAAVATTSN